LATIKSWSCELNDRRRQVQTDAVATEMAIDELRDEILKLLATWPQGEGLRLKLALEIHLPQFP
jgi:hypothetical protein